MVVGSEGTVTAHAPDMPASGDPWRTLVEGTLVTDTLTHVWRATATLGAAVPPGRTVSITWAPGRQQPDGCEPMIGITEPAATVAPDGTVSVERRIEPGYSPETPDPELTCLTVWLRTDDVQTDALVGPMTPLTRLAGAQASPTARLHVAAGRTTPVLLGVTSHVRGTGAVSITGTGPGVRMPALTVGPVLAGQTRPVVARISARGIADTELRLAARDHVGSDSFDQSWKVVARRITAQRPDPGRYRSKDRSIRFRVTEKHRVVRLRSTAVRCEGSGVTRATYPLEIGIPRDGATAKVTQLSTRWYGAQLMTRGPSVVHGTFFFSTPSCASMHSFVARRLR